MKRRLIPAIALAALFGALSATAARAQAPPDEAQRPLGPEGPPAHENGAPPEGNPHLENQFTPQSLAQMLAPIALYPDELLGDILMAATYPLDVVKAARWLEEPHNAALKGDQLFAALKDEDWDPSVKSLAPFPRVLHMMDANLEWTQRLGEAFLADPEAVMDAVQRLRRRAQSAGRLYSAPQEIVRTTEEAITIEAPSPEIVYVPVCDPSIAYGAWPYAAYPPYAFSAFFGAGGCGFISAPIVAPLFGFHRLNFRKHLIEIDRDRFFKLDRDRAPIGGEEWLHDPSHRGNVPYRDAAVAARFGGVSQRRDIGAELRGYSPGSLLRIDRPIAAARPGRELIPPHEGAESLARPSVPPYGAVERGAGTGIPNTPALSARVSAPSSARFGGAGQRPDIGAGLRGYSPGSFPRIDRPFAVTSPERQFIPQGEAAEPLARPPVAPYGAFGRGAGARISSMHVLSAHVPAPSLMRFGGAHSFPAPIGARVRTAPTIGVQPFAGGVRGH